MIFLDNTDGYADWEKLLELVSDRLEKGLTKNFKKQARRDHNKHNIRIIVPGAPNSYLVVVRVLDSFLALDEHDEDAELDAFLPYRLEISIMSQSWNHNDVRNVSLNHDAVISWDDQLVLKIDTMEQLTDFIIVKYNEAIEDAYQKEFVSLKDYRSDFIVTPDRSKLDTMVKYLNERLRKIKRFREFKI